MWYCYEKISGKFAGSGVTKIDTDTHGSTNIEPPQHDNGVAIWTGSVWKIRSTNPSVVSPRQLRLAMLGAGIDLTAIDTMIADNQIAKIEWEYATEIHREHELLNQLAMTMGLTSSQVDAVFAAAREI